MPEAIMFPTTRAVHIQKPSFFGSLRVLVEALSLILLSLSEGLGRVYDSSVRNAALPRSCEEKRER